MEQIYHIYDRIFKRIFSLSDLAIINLINGLFHTNYPPDSKVTYPNKEFIKPNLYEKLADILILINGESYHLEAQMTSDDIIVVRVFEYGFLHALQVQNNIDTLVFPEPVIIYLDEKGDIPEKSFINLDFGRQGIFRYEVKNFVYQKHDVVELNQKKMIVLIPFQLLKLRSLIESKPTKENFHQLKNLIENDIIESIKANLQVGNITEDDANQLRELTKELFEHIYARYEEVGGYKEVKPLLDGAIELPLDKYRKRIDELEQEKEREKQEKEKAEQEIQKLQERIKELEKA